MKSRKNFKVFPQLTAVICLMLFFIQCYGKKKEVIIRENMTFRNTADAEKAVGGFIVPERISINVTSGQNFPVSGTVSHHLLVAPIINSWFMELKSFREIDTFVILSPDHRRRTKSSAAVSRLDWDSGIGIVRSDTVIVDELISAGIPEEDAPFKGEHGIEALLPFIKKYFPEARIVSVLFDEFNKRYALSEAAADVFARHVRQGEKLFLIVSTDFSHKGGRKITDARDSRSQKSLEKLDYYENRPYCDNNIGLMTMYRYCENLGVNRTHFFCHTDAEIFTGIDLKNDITSYFFTFQY